MKETDELHDVSKGDEVREGTDGLDRRRLLRGAGTVTALGVLGSLWSADPTRAASRHKGDDDDDEAGAASLVIDVACIGSSFFPDFGSAADPANGDLRGGSFLVEGLVYDGRAIPRGAGFDPSSIRARGTWLCRGWFLAHPARPTPEVLTTQEYYVDDVVSPSNPSPSGSLVSSGTEGTPLAVTRAVLGGTGRFRLARGQVVQRTIGSNTTVINGLPDNAPNFRFTFRFD